MPVQGQPINSQQTDGNSAQFQRRWEAGFAWTSACGAMLALPGLRGFWPMSAFDGGGGANDYSGQARTLTYNGNPTYNYSGLAPYIDLDGTGDYLSRVDEVGTSIVGTETYVAAGIRGLTIGGWFNLDSVALGPALIGKWGVTAASGAYMIFLVANNTLQFLIEDAAGATDGVNATVQTSLWYHIVGRYIPSLQIDIWVDGIATINAVGIPAALRDNAIDFRIGAYGAPVGNYMDGRASMCFLCTTALSDAHIMALYHKTKALYGVK
jgi:hypothetical protein